MREQSYRPYAPPCNDDLTALLPLTSMGERSYRSGIAEGYVNKCPGAGLVAGQVMWAAAQSAQGWQVSAVQLCMLRAPRFQGLLEYAVESSSEKPQTLTRHVYAVEGLETVASAHVRYCKPDEFLRSPPATAAAFAFDEALSACPVNSRGPQHIGGSPSFIEVRRPVQPQPGVTAEDGTHLRTWCRLVQALPLESLWCSSALVFLAASSVAAAVGGRGTETRPLGWDPDAHDFSMLFHSGAFDVNDWLLFDGEVLPEVAKHYSLKTKIYDRFGVHIATSLQTCVDGYGD